MTANKFDAFCSGFRQSVDNSFLVYFRILFGLIMAVHFNYFLTDHFGPHSNLVESYLTRPSIHYAYFGFGWIKPFRTIS